MESIELVESVELVAGSIYRFLASNTFLYKSENVNLGETVEAVERINILTSRLGSIVKIVLLHFHTNSKL